MMNLADPTWAWYKSVNFYLVLAFGFGTYLLWGFIYEAVLAEHGKKYVTAATEIEIKDLKVKIRQIEKEVIDLKKQLSDLQKEFEGLKIEIESLRKELDAAALRPEELLRNMENFYAGWLGFLNGISESNLQKASCEAVYKTFNQSLRQQLN